MSGSLAGSIFTAPYGIRRGQLIHRFSRQPVDNYRLPKRALLYYPKSFYVPLNLREGDGPQRTRWLSVGTDLRWDHYMWWNGWEKNRPLKRTLRN